MASTSNAKPSSAKYSNSIDKFCSVTGTDRDNAARMLEACNWNLEMAINMHVDSNFQDDDDDNYSGGESSKISSSDDVRAPIPQSREILVEGHYTAHYGLRGTKRRPRRTILDGFRDFEAEAQWQEKELGGQLQENDSQKKPRKTIEDLYRPPLDLMHRGSFDTAREVGRRNNKWLMVNIQDSQEFACQLLNRDIWSNATVRGLVAEHFVFWQVHCDSSDGQRYMQFYNPVTFPYVAIIDPRTGEKLIHWNKIDAVTFCDVLSTFLTDHSAPHVSIAKPKSRSKKKNLLDESEDHQIKAAMEASLKDYVTPIEKEDDDDTSSDIETFDSDSESQHVKILPSETNIITTKQNANDSCKEEEVSELDGNESSWKDCLGSKDDETTDLVLRLPDGNRERVTWPYTSKLKALILYAETLGYKQTKYELVTNFPRKNLGQLPLEKTLKDLGLYPREMIFIQLKTS